MNALSLACLILAVGLSGCAGAAPAAVTTSPATTAPTAAPGADTGSISGTVTDDELNPIAGAKVFVVEAKVEATTDGVGAFTFNNVAPATYRIIADALGYESGAKKVEVRSGEVAKIQIALEPMIIPDEPFVKTHERVSFIQFDQENVGFVFVLANVNHSAICGSCYHTLQILKGPKQVLIENYWTATQVDPVLNSAVAIWWQYYDPKGEYHNNLEQYANRESRRWTATEETELMTSEAVTLPIIVESGLDTVSFQHRVNTLQSFAYLADFPEEFTALPPA